MPSLPILIGLVGATGCGKTTLANELVAAYGYTRAHMGQPIKDMLAVLGLTPEQLNGPTPVRRRPSPLLGGKSPRWAMETLGTNWGRHMMAPTIWANAVDARLRAMWAERATPVVIDDLRFPSDWAVVQKNNGVLVRIVRPGLVQRRKVVDWLAHHLKGARPTLTALGADPVHETEYHWHDAPAAIELINEGTPTELAERLFAALKPPPDSSGRVP